MSQKVIKKPCPGCGRKISIKFKNCPDCGASTENFELIQEINKNVENIEAEVLNKGLSVNCTDCNYYSPGINCEERTKNHAVPITKFPPSLCEFFTPAANVAVVGDHSDVTMLHEKFEKIHLRTVDMESEDCDITIDFQYHEPLSIEEAFHGKSLLINPRQGAPSKFRPITISIDKIVQAVYVLVKETKDDK